MKACEEGQLFFAEWKIDGHILSLLLSSPLKSLTIFSLLLVIGEAESSPLRSIFCSICSRLWAEMEFEDQEEHEEEMEMAAAASYDSLGNSGPRVKMPSTEQPAQRKPRYRECLKNHAVGLGGHALDGCGEFLAAGAEGTLDALKCAACNCHRNFHRKESDAVNAGVGVGEPFLLPHHPHPQFSPYYRTPAGYLHVAPHHRPLALPSTSGGGGTHSREDQEDMSNPSGGGGGSSLGKKRFRTKFTQEQKDRMLGLAETLGWRIQKHDEAVVQQFCNETGVKRHVLKVWMHNNKHTLGKKP